ncbi:iap 2 [Philosamia cynthia ricini nucleopolyhedrovirus virus]|nr:iap 2 [Philosamia cynthia ricini nucleopolyhedrovirus virus]
MDLQKFNFVLLSTQGRARTMALMSLDHAQKTDLAQAGLFFHNNLIKCIGCSVAMDKIDAKCVKRHAYSSDCVAATNALLASEALRAQSFARFKWARRQFGLQPRVANMLARRGFYCFKHKLRCAGCKCVVAFKSVDLAQRAHSATCAFRHVVDLDAHVIGTILGTDLPPPKLHENKASRANRPSAPPADNSVSDCKVCFDSEKSVCFLPCRHLAVCAACSPRCKRCCVCQGKIASRIETLPQ